MRIAKSGKRSVQRGCEVREVLTREGKPARVVVRAINLFAEVPSLAQRIADFLCSGGPILTRISMKRTFSTGLLILLAGIPKAAPAQDMVKEALASFPPQTIRVEYLSPAKLRRLPNYQNLHQRYVGPRLQALEGSLGQIGIKEDDIDDLLLGWQSGRTEMDMYGFASGRFDAKGMTASAAAHGITPSTVSGHQAYCLEAGLAGTCMVVLDGSLGAFGTLSSLTALLDARAGSAPGLSSQDRLTPLLGKTNKDAPIWGIALGPAVGDWFRGWMPSQENVKLDWGRVFQKVNSLIYSVQAGDKVNLDLKLDCASAEDAASLRQVLEGLKLAQQLAWQNQNPNRPNPYQAIEVGVNDREISMQVATGYSELEIANGVAGARN